MSKPAQEQALIRLSDELEAAAYRSMYAAAPAELAQMLGLRIHEIDDACAMMSLAMPTPVFNRVIGLGNRQSVMPVTLEKLEALYQEQDSSKWWLHVSPAGHEVSLQALLAARGYELAERRSWAKMYRATRPVDTPACQAEVRAIRPEEALQVAETLCAAYDMPVLMAGWFESLARQPNWYAAAAWLDGKVVGGGFLFIHGQHAWLGAGGVRPEARGMHVHRALMTLRIKMAIDAGCHGIFTETGEAIANEANPSLRNMRACGFTRICSRLNFSGPASIKEP